MIAITAPFWTLELLHNKLDVIFAPTTAPTSGIKDGSALNSIRAKWFANKPQHKRMIAWHKRQTDFWKTKLGISDYGMLWVAWVKGIVLGLLVYHFFIAH